MHTDCHNHTCHFSGDARMTLDELLNEAKRIGLDAVVITEHYESDYPQPQSTPQMFDLDEYFSALSSARLRYPDGPTLLSGIELGYQNHLSEQYSNLISQYPFDSVIASNHLYVGQDPYFFQECYSHPKEEVYGNYIRELTHMVENLNCFDIVGHFDYMVRYAPYPDPTLKYKDAPDAFDDFFKALVKREKSLEINTRSITKLEDKGISDSWPDREILERYLELGGERVSLGSDSHDTSSLGCLFDAAASYLKSCGFKDITTYVGRKEIRIPIE